MSPGGRLDGESPASQRGLATRDVVLAASIGLFADHGVAATTMRQIAEHSALPLSAFYYYFNAKYDVLVAIMDSSMERLEIGVAEAWDDSLPCDALLAALVASHVRVHLNAPEAAKVADRELRALTLLDRERVVKRRDAYELQFRNLLARGKQEGLFHRDLDVPLATMAILAMSTGVVDWWRPDGRLDIADTSKMMGEFAVSLTKLSAHSILDSSQVVRLT